MKKYNPKTKKWERITNAHNYNSPIFGKMNINKNIFYNPNNIHFNVGTDEPNNNPNDNNNQNR